LKIIAIHHRESGRWTISGTEKVRSGNEKNEDPGSTNIGGGKKHKKRGNQSAAPSPVHQMSRERAEHEDKTPILKITFTN
jgi:hypothetical protein